MGIETFSDGSNNSEVDFLVVKEGWNRQNGISPECFFAGVCFGGLVTLPLQLGIGFLLRERPVFALATVATTVGVWTVFPYAVAASTALFLFLRRRYFT
uniref:Uncharacterized protein n=1 Tax=Vitis vinifera TaxID=29760 RepID=F6I023_VITVI